MTWTWIPFVIFLRGDRNEYYGFTFARPRSLAKTETPQPSKTISFSYIQDAYYTIPSSVLFSPNALIFFWMFHNSTKKPPTTKPAVCQFGSWNKKKSFLLAKVIDWFVQYLACKFVKVFSATSGYQNLSFLKFYTIYSKSWKNAILHNFC